MLLTLASFSTKLAMFLLTLTNLAINTWRFVKVNKYWVQKSNKVRIKYSYKKQVQSFVECFQWYFLKVSVLTKDTLRSSLQLLTVRRQSHLRSDRRVAAYSRPMETRNWLLCGRSTNQLQDKLWNNVQTLPQLKTF